MQRTRLQMAWRQEGIFSNLYRKFKSWFDRRNCWYVQSHMKSIWKRKEITALTGLPVWSSDCLWSPVKVSSIGRESLCERGREGLAPCVEVFVSNFLGTLEYQVSIAKSSSPVMKETKNLYKCQLQSRSKVEELTDPDLSLATQVCGCVHGCAQACAFMNPGIAG